MPPAVEVQRLNHWATREFQERDVLQQRMTYQFLPLRSFTV